MEVEVSALLRLLPNGATIMSGGDLLSTAEVSVVFEVEVEGVMARPALPTSVSLSGVWLLSTVFTLPVKEGSLRVSSGLEAMS